MELPNLSMEKWRKSNRFKQTKSDISSRRTSVANVSKYYTDYVDLMGMSKNFRGSTVVTEVKQIYCHHMYKSPDAPVKISFVQDIVKENVDHNLSRSEEVFAFDVQDIVPDDISSQCSSLTQKHSLLSVSLDARLPKLGQLNL